ncbi:MAG: toxin-activating lysine-acyltransferase [Erythrobacter sp.]|nr:MAG: toxin-activating lysine-acyltransferase [Erythrobacter sp.]
MADSKPSRKAAKSAQSEATTARNDTADMPDQKVPKEFVAQIEALRASVRENFGKAAMAMMMLPRYRNQTIGDLQHLVLEPLMRDRLAMAYPKPAEGDAPKAPREMIGFAIWATVSDEVDQRIAEQIRTGTFPVRLKPEEWNSGDNKWLLDVVAPTQEATISVLTNFRQVAKEGMLKLHPLIARLLPPETLEKLGAAKLTDQAPAADDTIN